MSANPKEIKNSKYTVREADVVKERDILLDLLKRNRQRPDEFHEKRYDWLYLQNPLGQATAWIIWDEENNKPVGFTGVFPRKMLVESKEIICWNCGDFSIDRAYRTLGIAVKLRKAAKDHIDKGNIPFLYAHPNEKMVHIHLRAGHKKLAKMTRFALPIRSGKYLENFVLGKFASRLIDPVISRLLRFKFQAKSNYANFSKQEMQFTDEHEEISRNSGDDSPVMGLRDVEYLKWKYQHHPVYEYQLFNYYLENKLSGYIIYHYNKHTISLVDFIFPVEIQKQTEMLTTFINYCLREMKDISVISTVIQEFNPVIPSLLQCGFRNRKDADSDVIVYSARPELKNVLYNGKNWYMNTGDRDA